VLLASVARLISYATVCAALPALRAQHPEWDRFRLPAGGLFAWSGIAFCVVLAAQMRLEHLAIILVVCAAAAANWAWRRGR
jgi:amino acid transporter